MVVVITDVCLFYCKKCMRCKIDWENVEAHSWSVGMCDLKASKLERKPIKLIANSSDGAEAKQPEAHHNA